MTVESATLKELQRLDAEDTPEGQSSLMLAAAIDSGRSLMAVPAMVKELSAQLRTIRDSTPAKGDAVDDVLGAYRAAKVDGRSDTAGVQRTTQRKRRSR